MARQVAAGVHLLVVLLTARCCAGRDFDVGGRDGWRASPAEPFNRWAERNRFQVNDSLVFRYSKDADAVLVVSQSHYDACNTTDPFLRLDGGDSVFVLRNSGPYFFISGDAGRCRAGERLIVVALAVRNRDKGNTPSPSLPPPPPTSSSPSSHPAPSKSPPPVPAPAPRALPPPPPAARNASMPSPSPANATAPAPGTNGTSSASALRAGVLACLVVGGAVILV
ncbi:early nodulin-like protein 18 [Phragmites australis]|uniref:early nodulin-like protein 18 n=1 Tax=Phragmites australis TaxID=29695 RepID=UPI002D795D44|nr:early nodulin-like protein 18 [Phragmites australis]